MSPSEVEVEAKIQSGGKKKDRMRNSATDLVIVFMILSFSFLPSNDQHEGRRPLK
jgi:hypothetical protein